MKKILISLCTTLLLLTANTCFPQGDPYKQLLPVTVFPGNATKILNMKVARSFEDYFKGATNLQWYAADKSILVKFILDKQWHRALFNQNGQVVYHISYGYENDLPNDIRSIVKREYYDQQIIRTYHIIQDKRDIWVINLEDAKQYLMVRVEDEELELTQTTTKTY